MAAYEELSETQQFACRVIADHARATAFAIADGILPGNEGRNYVLRKIMRRAIYHGREHLGQTDAFFYKVCDAVVDKMHGAFPELETQRDFIAKMVKLEEQRFGTTMVVGLSKLNELGVTASAAKDDALFASIAKLYDTFGTPRDLIRVFLEQKGVEVEEDDFNERFEAALAELQKQSGIGKTERKSEISPVYAEVLDATGKNVFHGYDATEFANAKVVAILDGDKRLDGLTADEQGSVILDNTPFYAESGGQVGDVGMLVGSFGSPPYEGGVAPASGDGVVLSKQGEDHSRLHGDEITESHLAAEAATPRSSSKEGSQMKAAVTDTYSPVAGLIVHKVKVEKGSVKVGDTVSAFVDVAKRDAARRNHTATHLLHAALKEVLGSHVKQAGSVVAPNYLRFDFAHYQPMTADEIAEVEDLVNRYILQNEPVTTDRMKIEDAMRSGAVAMFGEKYGAEVRVLSIGNGEFSRELCGGTHVRATGDIGSFKIVSDEAIASGVRRIRAITGFDAFNRFREDERLIDASLGVLKTQRDNLANAIERLQEDLKKSRKEIDDLRLKLATGGGAAGDSNDEVREIAGIKVFAKIVEDIDANGTRQLSDTLLARLKSGVVIVGRRDEAKAGLIVRVSSDLTGRVKAGDIIREIAPILGGKGGGKPDMAEGGGPDVAKLQEALDAVNTFIERTMA
ncbi:MAG TPA: alanine--tRNA ligase-related protein [Pyrinomonadaceae bacterium]|nr:alanine--tRNA ligase-related protein [Pyrinomonadaceae bacterium]